jgi:F-type H+-transporting ATPase subunit alpha
VSRAQLDRGSRLVELLKQPQYSPFPVEQQIVSVWMGTTGQIDDVPLDDVRRFEREFLDYLQRDHKGILDGIRETGALPDDTVTALKDAIDQFRRGFEVTGGELLVKDEDPGKPVDEGDVDPEKISRVVRKPPPEQANTGGSSSGGAQQG